MPLALASAWVATSLALTIKTVPFIKSFYVFSLSSFLKCCGLGRWFKLDTAMWHACASNGTIASYIGVEVSSEVSVPLAQKQSLQRSFRARETMIASLSGSRPLWRCRCRWLRSNHCREFPARVKAVSAGGTLQLCKQGNGCKLVGSQATITEKLPLT